MTHRTNHRTTNGHAGPHHRANGHAPASTARDQAASDDAGGITVASAASSAAAGAAPQACVEAASSSAPGENKENGNPSDKELREAILARPTDFDAMQDGSAYVDAVAARADLVAASVRLVSSTDEKIAKGELDRLREMKFGKVGPAVAVEEPFRVELGDMPRPVR